MDFIFHKIYYFVEYFKKYEKLKLHIDESLPVGDCDN